MSDPGARFKHRRIHVDPQGNRRKHVPPKFFGEKERHVATPSPDVKLLRAIALGGKRAAEIQLLLDSQAGEPHGFQKLALLLADISVPEDVAAATLEQLRTHQSALKASLGRPVSIKTAALDFLEQIESTLGLSPEEQNLTYDQLFQMAFRDHLTGLPNFRSFSKRLKDELQRANRYRHLVSLVMLDIDYFKRFNDRFLHAGGNLALEYLSKTLQLEVDPADFAARYGGEEFAILMPETAKHSAARFAERLRAQIEAGNVLLPEGPQKITVSLGLATFPRDARDAHTLLQAADAALYESKRAGRNRLSACVPEHRVELAFRPERPEAVQKLAIVGDFNGWDSDADALEPAGDGRFAITLALAPGRYVYKFVVNGEFYISDPLAGAYVNDGYGGKNAVLFVK